MKSTMEESIRFRCSRTEKAIIARAASLDSRKMSDFIRVSVIKMANAIVMNEYNKKAAVIMSKFLEDETMEKAFEKLAEAAQKDLENENISEKKE
jgi:uncharacterized protein (DUF1778 family)